VVAVEPLVTTVTNLVVTPQTTAVMITCTTSAAVSGRLQIGTALGTYTTFTSGYDTMQPLTYHTLYGYGLAPATLYHYIIQWYDQNLNALDATADATFTTLAIPAAYAGGGMMLGGSPALYGGAAAPAAALGNNGDFFFNSTGAALTTIYQKRAGAWVGIV
jgi:hypothetical protein